MGGRLGFLKQDDPNVVLLGLHHSMAGSLTNFSCCERQEPFVSETVAVYVLCSVAEFLGKRYFKLRSCQTPLHVLAVLQHFDVSRSLVLCP